MKNVIAITALTLSLSAPAFASSELTTEEVEEMLAMSNSSAAERIVGDTSTGNPKLAEIKFALGEMSAAERRVFFAADETTREELIKDKMLLNAGNSAAETAAIGTATQ